MFKTDILLEYIKYKNCFIGCLGTPVELSGSKGLFGINDDQYYSGMTCSWKVQIEPTQVTSS